MDVGRSDDDDVLDDVLSAVMLGIVVETAALLLELLTLPELDLEDEERDEDGEEVGVLIIGTINDDGYTKKGTRPGL